ncbi:hypothetical protein O3M35_006369 [Rhynocoris fuscipes]|uniref:Uncharacterized protein n=1 Tax=Rhynocoris fuscipes TaxID=488301 RepID=A0AAW1DDT8_9HEMI
MKIVTELETFPSTYKKDYKWFENVIPAKQNKDYDAYQLSSEDKEKFQMEDIVTLLSPEEKAQIMVTMTAKIMKSVTGVDYSLESLQAFKGDPKTLYNPENDKLLTIARDLYKVKYPWFKTLPPLPTSRRVQGFSAPRDYYMPLSEYQDTYSREGYTRLKADADKGFWRLAPKEIPEVIPTELKCKK